MRLFMNLRRNHSPAIAGAEKAGFSTAAAYRIAKDLPGFPAKEGASRTTPSRSIRRSLGQ